MQVDNQSFVRNLEGLVSARERGTLAHLRRGADPRPAAAADAYPYVYRLLPVTVPEGREEVYVLVAGLFARFYQGRAELSRREGLPWDLGASLTRLKTPNGSDSLEKRFVALLKSDKDELHVHLRHAVALLSAEDIPINWVQLIHDVHIWDDPRQQVQQRWARSYWRFQPQPAAAAAPSYDPDVDDDDDNAADAGDAT